jgi:hypothetical protein
MKVQHDLLRRAISFMSSLYSPAERTKERIIDQKVVISDATEEGLIPRLNFRNVEDIKVEGGVRTDFLNPVNPILICQGNERYTYRLVWEYPPRLSLDFGSHSQASASKPPHQWLSRLRGRFNP